MTRMLRATLVSVLLATPALAGKPKAKDKSKDAPPPTEEASTAAKDAGSYRHAYFEGLGKHMKASGMIVKGVIDRPEDLPGHASAIAAVADLLPGMFPAGTGPEALPKTEALPVIWEKPDEFKTKASAFAEKARAFAETAAKGDLEASKGAFFALGKSCGDCHDTFRKDDD